MTLTLGNWIGIGFIIVCGGTLTIAIHQTSFGNARKNTIVSAVATLVITIIFILLASWYNTNTASGQRKYKSYQSNIQGGIERTIDIYDKDGELVYHYQGKIDIEDESQAYCLWFESEEGLRTIIHYSITDRVFVQEVKNE